MVLPELQQVAGTLGISGAGKMRKAQLVEAITAAQSGGSAAAARQSAPGKRLREASPRRSPDVRRPADPRPRTSAARRRPRTLDRLDRLWLRARPDGRADYDSDTYSRSDSDSDREPTSGRAGREDLTTRPAAAPGAPHRASATVRTTARTTGRTARSRTTARAQNRDRQHGQPQGGQSQGGQPQAGQGTETQGGYDDYDRQGNRRRRGRNRDRSRPARDRFTTNPGGRRGRADVHRGRRPGAGGRHPRHPRQLRLRAHLGLPPRSQRRLRLAEPGPQGRPAQGRRDHRCRQAAAGRRRANPATAATSSTRSSGWTRSTATTLTRLGHASTSRS